ncbi:MAG TPA: D-alanine--D-alanine ligase [Gemmatimonadaceae bacterium]|nr:D-alanine--D-alanine ligase [Gemmatimonadaceae bacterium]
MKITVLMGGTSAERDVSLASGLRVAEALRTKGHDVVTLDTARGTLTAKDEKQLLAKGNVVKTQPPSKVDLDKMAAETLPQMLRALPSLKQADLVFLGLHGGYGEDGTIQSLLDMAGIKYTGSGHLASALAMDKDLSKHLFRRAGVQTADWMMARRDASAEEQLGRLTPPVVVKPSKQGSTVGLSVVRKREELHAAIADAFQYDDEVMIEQFVAGRELTVGILGDDALPVGEIIPKHEIYDYECKYTVGMAEEVFPAQIPNDRARDAQEMARRAFQALKLRGYARIDFRMTEDGSLFCLEANTLPGMTQTSLIPQGAAAAGISFPDLCERIALLALSAEAKPAEFPRRTPESGVRQ